MKKKKKKKKPFPKLKAKYKNPNTKYIGALKFKLFRKFCFFFANFSFKILIQVSDDLHVHPHFSVIDTNP
jgi:hypothetical protein